MTRKATHDWWPSKPIVEAVEVAHHGKRSPHFIPHPLFEEPPTLKQQIDAKAKELAAEGFPTTPWEGLTDSDRIQLREMAVELLDSASPKWDGTDHLGEMKISDPIDVSESDTGVRASMRLVIAKSLGQGQLRAQGGFDHGWSSWHSKERRQYLERAERELRLGDVEHAEQLAAKEHPNRPWYNMQCEKRTYYISRSIRLREMEFVDSQTREAARVKEDMVRTRAVELAKECYPEQPWAKLLPENQAHFVERAGHDLDNRVIERAMANMKSRTGVTWANLHVTEENREYQKAEARKELAEEWEASK